MGLTKKIIIFWSDYRSFNENSKYLYLYLIKKSLKPMWVTESNEVFEYLKSKKLPVIKRNIFSIYYFIRAGVLFGAGEDYPNFLNLMQKETIRFNLRHGCGPASIVKQQSFKLTKDRIKPILDKSNFYAQRMNQWDYINFTSKISEEYFFKIYGIEPNKMKRFGFPRCEGFFDRKKMIKKLRSKSALKKLGHDGKKKFILYAPTWRVNRSYFPLDYLKGFNFEKFSKFLTDNNFEFLINPHMNSNFNKVSKRLNLKNKFTNIHFLKKNDLTDINEILTEIDILITDYSSIATDFGILKRKILYVIPDYKEYKKERGIIFDIKEYNCGQIIKNYSDLKTNIKNSKIDKKLKNRRKKYFDLYYDKIVNSNKRFYDFLKTIQ